MAQNIVPAIAPAVTAAQAKKPVAQPTLVVSKQYFLPPRPKPGPRPNGARRTDDVKTQLEYSRRENNELRSIIEELKRDVNLLKEKSPESNKSKTQHATFAPVVTERNPEKQKSLSTEINVNAAPVLATDDSCGMCTSETCVCDEVGLKPSHSMSVDPLAEFEHFSPQKAVPLRRRTQELPRSSGVKRLFKRAGEVSQPPSKASKIDRFGSDESPLKVARMSAHENPCGFCSDDTPCLCADDVAESSLSMSKAPLSPVAVVKPALMPPAPFAKAAVSRAPLATAPTTPLDKPRATVDLTITPPSSVPSRTPSATRSAGCEPGSCSKCQADAIRTLFCSSLAEGAQAAAESSMSVSCSQAYEILSRHAKFFESDLGVIVQGLAYANGKVSVQSIQSTLKKLG